MAASIAAITLPYSLPTIYDLRSTTFTAMTYHIQSFNGNDPGREHFERFAEELYRGDPFFRPPAAPPDSARWFLLRDANNAPCARAAVLINPGISYDGRRTALVGWYECVQDEQASNALFEAIIEYCNAIQAEYLLGPMNGDTWHSYRIALPSDSPPFFLEPYNKPWYAGQFEKGGCTVVGSYHSSRIPAGAESSEEINARVERFREEGITIRELDQERFEEEVKRIYSISVEAFQANPFYTPITEEETLAMYLPLQKLADPTFVLIAEDREGQAVGFVFAVRNLFDPSNTSLIVKTAAVRRSQFGKGLGSLLIELIHLRGTEKGYNEMIHALMYDANPSARVLRDSSHVIRRYNLYGRAV